MKKSSIIMKYVTFIVVLIIPIIYSFVYLKAYWDPYGNLSEMKLAIVNQDKGKDGENAGDEFVDKLKDSDTFDICEVDEDTATQGLQSNEYYAVVTIPSNFSEDLNSAATNDKQIATLTYNPNQASNYLGTQIINSAMKTAQLELVEQVDSKVAEGLADNLEEVPDSLNKIADGSSQILDGTEDLNSGLGKLKDGTGELSNKYTEFDNGVNSAYAGSKTLENGLETAQNGVDKLSNGADSLDSAISQINSGANELSEKGTEGIKNLSAGISTLNSGAKDLSEGTTKYVDGTQKYTESVGKYTSGVSKYSEGVEKYIEGNKKINENAIPLLEALAKQTNSDDPTTKALATKAQTLLKNVDAKEINEAETTILNSSKALQSNGKKIDGASDELNSSGKDLKNGANTLYAGTSELYNKSGDLNSITDGISTLQTALDKVQTGTNTLKTGITTLSDGTVKLSNGSKELTNGLETLDSSSKTVKTALNTLDDGANDAYNGSTKLKDGAKEFDDEINQGIDDTNTELTKLNGIEDFAKEPVKIDTEEYGEVSTYGVAFTPLFLCIGLWVGAFVSYVVLYYDQKHRFKILDSKNKYKLLQNLVYILIGGFQGAITAWALRLGLDFNVENVGLYYGVSILLGVTFMSIIQFLIRNFGDIGKFLALIILILQLAASGGTFPVETVNKVFQAISPYLPMTYAIKLLKEVLVPTATNYKADYIAILICIDIIVVAITYLVDIIKVRRVKTKKAHRKLKIFEKIEKIK